jgi:NADH dehydrogenase [ubiquinone] 1 alpha subcomplex assembly factor 7
MQACLHDEEHGYYRTRQAIGKAGDFITAPEISQVFGELIGLWCAIVWEQMGKPAVFNIVEFGPGRGTMMRDALRACRVVPDFLAAVRVTLIESNPELEKLQRETLGSAGVAITWFTSIDNARDKRRTGHIERKPGIVLANEFLDTLTAGTIVFSKGEWLERHVGLDARDRLTYVNQPWRFKTSKGKPKPRRLPGPPRDGDVLVEAVPPGDILVTLISTNGSDQCCALFLDYGHEATFYGDSVQAIRDHQFEHPLTSPGEADLSTQVDFEDMASWFSSGVWANDGPITQAEFLGNLGIMQRASKLMAANPTKANEIETGVARLMAPNGMGTRFKVLGVRSKDLPPLPGFPVPDGGRR